MTTMSDDDFRGTSLEADLRERDRLLRELAENVPDMVAYYDAQLRCVFCNQQYAVATGWTTESIVGRSAPEILGKASWRVVAPYVRKVLQGVRVDYARTWTIATGEPRIIEAHFAPHFDLHGTLVGIIVLVHDITDYRRAEEAMHDSDLELAKRARELARSNADLEQVAYIASHDLQEPLRMIAGFLTLLEGRYRDKIDKDATEFIGFAVDGARRMQVLISDLLTYSRVGTQAKPFQPTDCTRVVEIALRNLSMAIKESGATVAHDALPTVMGDATQLTQLFQNLVANALKFRGAQPPEVRVQVQPEDGFWRFSIRDNGIGIAPEHFEKIFVLFKRLHTQREYSGTGLGLAICKKIVESHGGQIWVESQPGSGTCFYFTIPQVDPTVSVG
jgi:PAS domain S-box-containing protein